MADDPTSERQEGRGRDSRGVRGNLPTAVRGELRAAGRDDGTDGPTPSVEVSFASATDVPAIRRIEVASFPNPGEVFNARQIRYLIGRATVLVARCPGGAVLGWAAGLVRRGPSGCTGRVYALAVAPEGRGQGVGRALTERLIQLLRGRGAGRIFLEVRADNHAAIGLYRMLGFVDYLSLPDYYQPGVHGLRMVLEPPAA